MGMTKIVVACLGVLVMCIYCTSAQSLTNAKTLMTDMLTGYDRRHRPIVDQSKPININISFDLVAIQDFNEVNEKFSVVGLVYMMWIDEDINWNPASYGGLISQMFPIADVWYPILVQGNPYTSIKGLGDTDWMTVRYYFSGHAVFSPGAVFKSTCSADVTYYPFDTQECELIMLPWGYSDDEITITASHDKALLTYFSENGEWDLIDSSVKVEGPSMLKIDFKIKRKPMFLFVNVILPILFMAVINILVFFLPAESGERVSFAVTVLLALAVFLTLVGDNLPKTSQPMAILSFYLMSTLIISVLMCVIAILNLNLYFRKSDIPVPGWCAFMTRKLKCQCRQKSGSPRHSVGPLQIEELDEKREGLYMNNNQRNEKKAKATINATWQEVSMAVDTICIVIFTLALFIVNTVFLTIMINNS